MAPRDPRVPLIQATNLPDIQIISNLLDSVEKQIFTLIIHSGPTLHLMSLSARVGPHRCTQQARKCKVRMETNLSSHSLLLCSLCAIICFSFFFQLCIHSGRVIVFLCCHKISMSNSSSLYRRRS